MMTDDAWRQFHAVTRMSPGQIAAIKIRKTREDRIIRLRLVDIQAGICAICGQPMGTDSSIDHVLALSRGGKDALGNMVAAHALCNSDKSNQFPKGCTLVWLLSVNARLGVQPSRW